MSVKLFGKGLGIFAHPFDVSAPFKIDVADRPTAFIQDITLRPMGQLNQPETIKRMMEVKPPLKLDTLQTTIPFPTLDIRKNFEFLPIARPIVNTGIKPQLFSADSANAPFETLFHDFEIESFPFYNFWVPDELSNDRDERGDRKYEDLPRYIKITWNPAPDLHDPEERVRPKMVDKRNIRDVMFTREIERPKVFHTKGIGFTPEHLQPTGFSKIKSIIANGHLAPGVLETMVDMPLHNTGIESHRSFAGRDAINHFDEDAFLTNPAFAGVAVHELKAQVNQITNGIAMMPSIAVDGVSADLSARKADLVDGKFMIKKSLVAGGRAQIAGIHPSSPTLNFEPRMAMPSKLGMIDPVMEMARHILQPASVNEMKSTVQAKVKFFNPAIGGLVTPSKVNLMSAPHHVEVLSTIATHLPSLEILSRTNLFEKPRNIELPSLPSPKLKPLEYIGYVLEKYKRQASGVFVKIEDIDIKARDADYYIDTKVLYGEAYRYRIRGVLRWTRPNNQGVHGRDLSIQPMFGSHTAPLSTHKSSYFYSEWSHSWAYGTCMDDQPPPPPDELTVRPESSRKRIIITCRLPDNPQRDILKMKLFRKYQDQHGNDVSHWVPVSENGAFDRGIDFAPANLYFVDTDGGRLGYSQDEQGMRRVYAAQCISRHGEDSVLSEQLAVRLNADHYTRGEYPVEFASSAGVRPEYFGAFGSIPYKITKTEIVVAPPATHVGHSPGTANLVFTGRITMGNVHLDNGRYMCRVQSLDTGESQDIPFDVQLKNLPVRQEVSDFDFYIPEHALSGKNSNDFDSEEETKLRKEIRKKQNGKSIKHKGKDGEVHVYDRSSPGDRWKR